MTSPKILVVEDERITAEDLRDILTQMGYTVTGVVSTGAGAIRLAEQTAPDLILMDIRIQGDMDGAEAARLIRRRFDVPVVFLTAHADAETLGRAKLAEPLGYVVKPFQESELEASIEIALHKHRMDRQARHREELLEATLGSIGEGVLSMDRAGTVTYMNPAAEAWTGWEREEGVGRSIGEVFRLKGASEEAAVNPLLRVLHEDAISALEEEAALITRDGLERPIGGSAAPIKDHSGQIAGAVVVFGGRRDDSEAWGGHPQPESTTRADGFRVIAESPAMRQVIQFATRVAASEVSTILLEGESGTGKEILAKLIHYQSRRQAEPLIAVNCAAIPETLLESELFGYEKGAFTDARSQKKGILEMADRGTVLLDEIGEMPLVLQAKLLRVLEEQTIRRLGGLKDIQVDLRVIAATNRDLRDAVREGKFRVDLYYRLNVIQVVVPPLRKRKDDILPLANYFIGAFNQKFRRQVQGVSTEAAEMLSSYHWPGNVRELRNTIERAMVLEETSWIHPSSLRMRREDELGADPIQGLPREHILDTMSLEEIEKMMLIRALERAGWNQTQAARLIGISRDAMRYKMKKFDLRPPEGSEQ